MTAVTAFVQSSAAMLLTDGAMYDADGQLLFIGSKVLVSQPFRMAIMAAGCFEAMILTEEPLMAKCETQAEVMAALPAIVTQHRASAEAAGVREPDVQLFVALWSDRNDEPQLWSLSTCVLPYHSPGYQPATWFALDSYLGTLASLDEAIGRPCDDLSTIDAERDGLAILQHQRRQPWPNGRYYVGGRGELTVVTREGVTKRTLVEWPDVIGQMIDPSRDAIHA